MMILNVGKDREREKHLDSRSLPELCCSKVFIFAVVLHGKFQLRSKLGNANEGKMKIISRK